ncbi:MAG: hypothetical protein RL375_3387 [Pseudomonadota bacterium]|jgi:hypothetical protein
MTMIIDFLRRMLCRHKRGTLVAIAFDGEATYQCVACGKHVRRPL